MPALKIICRNLVELIRSVCELASYGIVFVCAFVSSRAQTVATVVALRSQLANRVDRVRQKKEPKPRFTPAFRLVWAVGTTKKSIETSSLAWLARLGYLK